MKWTAFPDEFDRDALALVWDAYQHGSIERDKIALAAFNVGGFAYQKLLSEQSGIGFAGAPSGAGMTEEEAVALVLDAYASEQAPEGSDAPLPKALPALPPFAWAIIARIAVEVAKRYLPVI